MIETNIELAPFTTFGVPAKAAKLAHVQTAGELEALLSENDPTHEPLLILGGGSNVLFTRDWPGLVVRNEIKGIDAYELEGDEEVLVTAGAGVNWHDLVLWTLKHGFFGLENLSLIPGCVGAAPIQNIGAYGVEIKDTFEELVALNLETKQPTVFFREDCEFGYRDSIFKRFGKGRYVILSVTFRLTKHPKLNISYGAIGDTLEAMGVLNPTPKDVSKAVVSIRQSKLPDPKEIGNGGSFFKNPEIPQAQFDDLEAEYPGIPSYPAPNGQIKVPAGWLIDKAGWKGHRNGEVGVHAKQALVLVNYGKGTGAQIWALAQEIMADIEKKYGIALTPEVNII